MDPDLIDPAVRAARTLPDIPVRTWWGRLIVRCGVHAFRMRMPPTVTRSRLRHGPVRARVFTPATRTGDAALLWIHGGGMVGGAALMDDRFCAEVAEHMGILVVSAEYRLAPRHPFPAAHDDVWAIWDQMQKDASALGIDPARVAVGGASAGGGLAASLVLRLMDAGGIQPAAQWLFAPMLDDRTAARAELDPIAHWVWDNVENRYGWTAYLGGPPGRDGVSAYAAPGRRGDWTGAPPTWISVGALDLFLAEDRALADRLEAAGVPVRWEQVDAVPHGFEGWAPAAPVSQALRARARAWLGEVLSATS